MKRLILIVIFVLMLSVTWAEDAQSYIVPNLFDVVYKDGTVETRGLASPQDANPQMLRTLSVTTPASTEDLYDLAVSQALSEPHVLRVEPVYYLRKESFVPNDVFNDANASIYDGWKFDYTGVSPVWQQIFDNYVTADKTDTPVVVAVIDDGVTVNHADLNVKVFGVGSDIAGTIHNEYRDPNGFGDDKDADPSPAGGTHGTHVAGIVGAIGNNATGTIGVYPNVTIMPIKVFADDGSGTTTDLAAGINYAVNHGADVINISLSYGRDSKTGLVTGFSTNVKNAIENAINNGIAIFAASGNASSLWSSPFIQSNSESIMAFPAAHQGVYSVGSVQYNNSQIGISYFSSISGQINATNGDPDGNGETFSIFANLDFVAPGSSIYSTYNGIDDETHLPITNKSGTSMSTPFMAGAFALLKAEYPQASNDVLYNALANTASTNVIIPSFYNSSGNLVYGNGLVQVDDALTYYLPSNLVLKTKNGNTPIIEPLGFHPLTKTYTLDTSRHSDVFTIEVTGTPRTSEVRVNGAVIVGESIDIPLNVGDNTITVEVDSIVGTTSTYLINLYNLSEDNTEIKLIDIEDGTLVYDRSMNTYNFKTTPDQTDIDIAVISRSSFANVSINGNPGKVQTLALVDGVQTFTITVTAEDGVTTEDTVLTVTKDAVVTLGATTLTYYDANDDVLSSATISQVDFVEGAYTHNRPALAKRVGVTYNYGGYVVPYTLVAAYNNQNLALNDDTVNKTYTFSLNLSAPNESLALTLSDSVTNEAYSLTLVRPLDTDASLSGITFTGSGLSVTGPSGTYTFKANYSQANVVVNVAPTSDYASVVINGNGGKSASVSLAPGLNTIGVVITSEDGLATSTYTLEITRDETFTLGDLELSFKDNNSSPVASVTLNHNNFSGSPLSYRLVYDQAATKLALIYDLSNYLVPYTLKIGGSDALSVDHNLDLSRKTLSLVFSDGSQSQTYTMVLDDDSPLLTTFNSLSLSAGSLSPSFNVNTLSYSVPNTTTSATLSASPQDPRMVVSLGGSQVTSRTFSLAEGANNLTVVIKPDATYYGDSPSVSKTFVINRAAAPAPDPGSGGGGGGSVPPPPPVVIPPSGTTEVTPVVETVTTSLVTDDQGQQVQVVSLTPTYLSTLLKNDQVKLDLTGSTLTPVKKLSLSKANMTSLVQSGKPLVVSLPGVELELSGEVLKDLSDDFDLTVGPVTLAGHNDALAPALDFSMLVGTKAKTSFDKPLALTFNYSPGAVKDPNKITVFYYNPLTKDWDYVGGKHTEGGKIVAKISHFSTYAVKEFDISFNDLAGHWAKANVEVMASKKITKGVTDNLFAPDDDLTNAQFITLITRVLALPDQLTLLPYTDLDKQAWYMDALKKAHAGGILKGAYNLQVKPNQPIERQVMATVLMNAYAYNQQTDKASMLIKEQVIFTDMVAIDGLHKRDVQLAYQLGLIKGMPDGNYYPLNGATRAEAMTVLNRLMNVLD